MSGAHLRVNDTDVCIEILYFGIDECERSGHVGLLILTGASVSTIVALINHQIISNNTTMAKGLRK